MLAAELMGWYITRLSPVDLPALLGAPPASCELAPAHLQAHARASVVACKRQIMPLGVVTSEMLVSGLLDGLVQEPA